MSKTAKQKFCPTCQKEVEVTGGAGFFSSVIGTLMFFLGGAPGARQSKNYRCSVCNYEFPPAG